MFIVSRCWTDTFGFLSGVTEMDGILTVLLGTNMVVGGLLGFVLDNTIPGKL